MSKIIVFAFPVFLAAMALEWWWDRRQLRLGKVAHSRYALNDTINSLSLGLLSQVTGVLLKFIGLAAYALAFEHLALFPDAELWKHWYGWLLALLIYDLCYYGLHRAGHEVALLWAAHVVHHQSQAYNLSTALRQTSTGGLLGWVFYLPLAVLGVPPLVFGIVALVDLLYQFWVHTEYVGKLGWFDRVFCSPSNHRVHHAVNEGYVDRNYGGILVVWDRLFGSFQEEQAPCVYGTRKPLNSWDPLWANAEVYAGLLATSWRTPSWPDKLRVWFKPPGWQPADALPAPAFDMGQVQRFDPPLSAGQVRFALAQYLCLMAAGTVFLWNADAMPLRDAALVCVALCLASGASGRALQNQMPATQVLALQAACYGALGALGIVPFFSPLTL